MFKKLFWKIFGVKFNGDNFSYDRQAWVKKNLPFTTNDLKLLDVGCGNGWGLYIAADKGYDATGLTYDVSQIKSINQKKIILNKEVTAINLDIANLRDLEPDSVDVILNFENIEHIAEDEKMISDMAYLLKKRGLIFFSTPNLFYKFPLLHEHGPFHLDRKDGGHVRKGYTLEWLERNFKENNLITLRKGFISGPASILLLSISRKIPLMLQPIFRLVIIPFTIAANLIDRIFFKKYPHSYSVYFILQKY
jgi:SAM-dependent methyltransferase